MNIQIFGKSKCFDTKKAERYFKERKIKDLLALIQYIAAEDRDGKVLENQNVLKTPIVRNGAKATVGYQPEVWKTWE